MRRTCIHAFLTLSVALSASAQCPDWSRAFASPGMDAPVRDTVVFDDGTGPALYAAGGFRRASGASVLGVARWNGTSWTQVGAGLAGTISALVVFDDGSGPKLYAGGTLAAGTGVQRWNGQQWSQFGAWLAPNLDCEDLFVRDLALYDSGSGPQLYVCGAMAGGNVLRWTGTSWASVGAGLANGVFSTCGYVSVLTVYDDGMGAGPALYAGGRFERSGTTPLGGVARSYGSAWTSPGAPPASGHYGDVNAFAAFDDGTGMRLYAGGFLEPDDTITYHLATWNGGAWTHFTTANGPNGTVTSLRAFDASSGQPPGLWVGGGFSQVNGQPAEGVALWNGSWSSLGDGNGLDGASRFEAFDDGTGSGTRAFAFGWSGAVETLDNGVWSLLDGGNGATSDVRSLVTLERPGEAPLLFASGSFETIGGITARHFARWDGTRWWSEPLTGSAELAVLDDGAGPKVYAMGLFPSVGAAQPYVLRRDGSAWTALPNPSSASASNALAFFDDGSGLRLYAAGSWGLMRLDGAAWTSVVGGGDGAIRELAVHDDGSGSALFLVGSFTTLDGVACRGVARWNAQGLDALGGGTNAAAHAVCVHDDGSGPDIYIGGQFDTAGGVACQKLARWNGQTWSPVGGGIQGGVGVTVESLISHDVGSGPELVAGGRGPWTVAGAPAGRIAMWDGATWNRLAGGVDLTSPGMASIGTRVLALASFDDGTGRGRDLFAGGSFLVAGGVDSSNIGRWSSCGTEATTFCHGDGSAAACPCGNASLPRDQAGCLHSFGIGGTLRVRGRASLAHDTLELLGGHMTNSSALYFQAANQASGGQGFAFGDGVKCTAGPFVRLGTRMNVNGASSHPAAGDLPISVRGAVSVPGMRHYQVHYRNSAPFCSPETFNLTNAVSVHWEI